MKNRRPYILSLENIVKIHETEYKCQNLQKKQYHKVTKINIFRTRRNTQNLTLLPRDVGILI